MTLSDPLPTVAEVEQALRDLGPDELHVLVIAHRPGGAAARARVLSHHGALVEALRARGWTLRVHHRFLPGAGEILSLDVLVRPDPAEGRSEDEGATR